MKVFSILLWILQLIFLLSSYESNSFFNIEKWLPFLIGLTIFNTATFFLVRCSIRKSLSIGLWSALFLWGYIIVFFQKYIDLELDNIDKNDKIFASSDVIIPCFIISLTGLLSFFLGYVLKLYRKPIVQPITTQSKTIHKKIRLKPLKILLVIVTLLFIVTNYKQAFTLRYSQEMLEEQAGTLSNYSNILFQVTLALLLAYQTSNTSLNTNKAISIRLYFKNVGASTICCIIAYCTLLLISGDRGSIIIILLFLFGCYILSTRKNISLIKVFFIIALAAFVITALGEIRRIDKRISFTERIKTGIRQSSERESSFSPYTDELAGSVNSLHYSQKYVPKQYPYLHGSFQLRQLVSAIPFSNRWTKTFFDPHFKYRSSAFYVTWLIQGEHYTYGSGTSCNADLYLSFGIWGILLGLFFWGNVYRYIEDRLEKEENSTLFYIISLFFFSYSIYVNRASLLSFVNFLVFSFILKYIYEHFIIAIHKK